MRLLHVLASILVAVGLLFAGAYLADAYQLPFFHSWSLLHGAAFVLLPVYAALVYIALRPLFVARVRVARGTAAEVMRPVIPVLGTLSVILSSVGLLIPFGSVLGIAVGHFARKRAAGNPTQRGAGLALFGVLIGYAFLTYWAYVVITVFFSVRGSRP